MVALELARVASGKGSVNLLDGVDAAALLDVRKHPDEDFCQNGSIVAGAVVVKVPYLQVVCYRVQLVVFQLLVQSAGDGDGVDVGVFEILSLSGKRCAHKRAVKIGIVRHQYRILRAEFLPELERLRLVRRILDHCVGDAGQGGYLFRYVAFGVDEGVEDIHHLAVFHLYRTDFGDAVAACRQSGGFQVKDNKFAVKFLTGSSLDGTDHVVDKVCLQTIDHAEVVPFFAGVHRIGKALHNTVVGDCHCAVSPGVRQLCQLCRAVHSVHGGHIRMQMQLHPLDGRIVGLALLFGQGDGDRTNGDVVLILIKGSIAAHHQSIALVELLDILLFVAGQNQLEGVGAGVVGDVDGENLPPAVLGGHRFLANNISPDGGLTGLAVHLRQRDGFFLDWLAQHHHSLLLAQRQVGAIEQQLSDLRLLSGGLPSLFYRCSRAMCALWSFQCCLLLGGQAGCADNFVVLRLIFVQRQHPVKPNIDRHPVLFSNQALDSFIAAALLNQVVAAVAQADGQRPVLQLLPAALKDAVGRVSPFAQLVQNILHRLAAEQLRAVAGHNLKQRQIGCLHDLLFHPRNLLHRDSLFRV